MNKVIEMRYCRGWLIISDSDGNRMQYLWYPKREALRRFKAEFGHTNKRNITLIDHTRKERR